MKSDYGKNPTITGVCIKKCRNRGDKMCKECFKFSNFRETKASEWTTYIIIGLAAIFSLFVGISIAHPIDAIDSYNKTVTKQLTASWYSEESCRREGTSGVMANGKVFKERERTCASWDYLFGTRLKIINTDNGKSVYVTVTDRGPNKKLYKKGRVIDLSKSAFAEIADLRQGVIPIKIEVIE